jgi:CheY-like chemotaxis protein
LVAFDTPTVGPRARILLVEDDQDTATTLTTLLTEEGHEVGVAHSLHAALRLARGRWDVVISDLGLPDGSGLELARQFKDAKHKPRLIALSGFGSLKDRSASRDAGFKRQADRVREAAPFAGWGILSNRLSTSCFHVGPSEPTSCPFGRKVCLGGAIRGNPPANLRNPAF